MEIVLVHWLIKHGHESAFEKHWRYGMTVSHETGFYREILTKPVSKPDPKFNTFSITDPNYTTFINIGIWESIEHFESAIKKFFPKASEQVVDGKRKQSIELEDFEFKIRERIVLTHIADRGGNLPPPMLSKDEPKAQV